MPLSRRGLLCSAGTAATLAALRSPLAVAGGLSIGADTAETLAGRLHASLSETQRQQVCFPWDHVHPKFGLLRTRVGNNWNVTEPEVHGDFFTREQQKLVREIFEQLIDPAWHERYDRQLEDDTGGFGHGQSIALIGEPGSGQFQFLLTGRHVTLRCDGDSAEHVAFGGPIFYGHDTGGGTEDAAHTGNVFWEQAVAANGVLAMLDGRQRELAMVPKTPRENAVAFRRRGQEAQGICVTDLSADQRGELERVLRVLLDPYRTVDRDEVQGCLAAQGGLDRCRLAFYQDGDLGNDGVYDNWRLEGPAFVWHYRGSPHVHVWVNVADVPTVPTNA